MAELIIIALFAATAWFWLDTMRVREAAVQVGKTACQRDGLLFLDDTVAFASMGLQRDARGHVALRRTYRFEFSDTGDNRLKGTIVMLGDRLETLALGSLYIDPHGINKGAKS
ncbi:MAG: DUF3301 domain-containing protein [Burkholderiales bacterium]